MTIYYEITPGGSGNGISDALKRMRCGMLFHLDSLRPPSVSEGEGTLVGTMAHAFVEIYTNHDAHFDPEQVEFLLPEGLEKPSYWPYANMEAVRMFKAYRERFTPTLGGTLVSAEQKFEVHELLGVALEKPFTARLDAIYDLGEVNDLEMPAGRYIVDYKFLSQLGEKGKIKYELSAQAEWYRYVCDANGMHTDGVVFVIGVKTKVPRFEVVVAQPFNDSARLALFKKMIEKPNQERTFNCMGEYGPCAHMRACLGE